MLRCVNVIVITVNRLNSICLRLRTGGLARRRPRACAQRWFSLELHCGMAIAHRRCMRSSIFAMLFFGVGLAACEIDSMGSNDQLGFATSTSRLTQVAHSGRPAPRRIRATTPTRPPIARLSAEPNNGHACTIGANDDLGLWNLFNSSWVRETKPGYFKAGRCQYTSPLRGASVARAPTGETAHTVCSASRATRPERGEGRVDHRRPPALTAA